MIYDVSHRNRIRYDGIVQLAQFNIRMEPIDWPDQTVIDHALTMTPAADLKTRPGSYLARLTQARIDAPLAELTIESRFRVRVDRQTPTALPGDPSIAEIRDAALRVARLDALAPANYVYPSPRVPLDPAIAAWCAEDLADDRPVVEAALALARRIKAGFTYDPDATEVDTPVAEAFAKRHGVCQDYTHIMQAGLRAAGLPAAYASGFLRTIPPAGKPRLVGADATHAWVLLWCGDSRGWIGFDPTNGVTTGSDHIVTAVGRDYADVSPLDGVFLGRTRQRMKVEVDVIPIVEETDAA